jgi:hypothetical protein
LCVQKTKNVGKCFEIFRAMRSKMPNENNIKGEKQKIKECLVKIKEEFHRIEDFRQDLFFYTK